MSGLSAEFLGALAPGAVALASLAGSWHCAAMCGGLATSVSASPGRAARYHLARLAGYASLGAAMGGLGQAAQFEGVPRAVSWAAALAVAVTLVALGVRVWNGRNPHLFRISGRVWRKLVPPDAGATRAGLASALLPCGWLHAFLAGAIAAGSPARGAIFLTAFWIGTVPALVAAPWAIRRALGPLAVKAPKLAGALLILAGLGSLGLRVSPLLVASPATAAAVGGTVAPEAPPGCPMHESTGGRVDRAD